VGERLSQLRRAALVDLCPSLQDVARRRIQERGWTNVDAVAADASTWRAPEPADVVTFSYSLTMIPDWFRAIDRAWEHLKPGGRIGVVDFYISRKWPEPALRRHTRFQRFLWPLSYAWDDVFLSKATCVPAILAPILPGNISAGCRTAGAEIALLRVHRPRGTPGRDGGRKMP
jgi:S-adenosylmethionine-diacylgycerolhomoserine-N-methlytransferase